jgi:PAS domain S-box-containing protein
MKLRSMVQRRAVAAAISAASVVLALVANEPSGLLVAIATVCICIGWQAGLAAVAVGAALLSSLMLLYPTYGVEDGLVRLVVFVAAACGIWLVVKIFRTISFYDLLYQGAEPKLADIPGLGWYADANGRIRYFNPAGLNYLGITADEARRLLDSDDYAWTAMVHPDDLETSLARWRHSMKTGEPLRDESRSRRHDGVYRWFRDTAIAARDDRGRVTGWYCYTEDIDDQRKAEAALRQSERELRLLVDTVPTMIWLMTPEGQPYYFNKRFVDWAGFNPDEEVSRAKGQFAPHVELFHPDDRADAKAAFHEGFAAGKPLQHKCRLRRKDGEYRWIDSRFEPLRDEDGTIIRWYGVNLDIDDEVRAQESLRLADERLARALRAASLSELSVSIAHELNQPLQAVVANAGAFQRWLDADPPNFDRARLVAEKIIRNANAAGEVITRIRALFGKTGGQPSPIDVNAVITEVCDLLSDKLQSGNVKLDLELDPSLPATAADHIQMEQVVLNLIYNSIEAMQDINDHARRLRIVSRRQGDDAVEVEVQDNGRGLSDPEKIFEAFYTTKKDGMGMGLAICRSIIESHGGRLWASNIGTGGASFAFSLPVRLAEASECGNVRSEAIAGVPILRAATALT